MLSSGARSGGYAAGSERNVPVIEEGLATVYSEDYLLTNYGVTDYTDYTTLDSYIEAAKLVRELLAFDFNAILKLRSIEPSFKKMSSDTFIKAGVIYPEEKIEKLISTFVRESK